MAGAISSLGLGSGTLTSDVIDSLKNADKSIMVTPVERKIEDNKSKTSELSMVTTMLATLKSSTSTLSDDTTYLSRSTSVTGDSVTATANSGVSIQDIDVSVGQLAKQSIFESSNTFSGLDDHVLSAGDNNIFSFFLGTSKVSVSLGDGAVSLSDLVTKINDAAGDKVTASTMNVGGDNPYKLILKSKDTGDANQIYFGEALEGSSVISKELKDGMSINGVNIVDSDTSYDSISSLIDAINEKADETNVKAYNNSGTVTLRSLDGSEIDIEDTNVNNTGDDWANLGFTVNVGSSEKTALENNGDDKTRDIIDALGINMLQKSQDSNFTFNGVAITRSTNVVDDLTVGLTLELQKVDSTGDSSTIKIKRDDSGMVDSVREMVAAYNQVLNKLTEVTDYNSETGEAGAFQGESSISRVKSSLNRILLTSDFTQDIHNLIEVGIELNEAGLLTFDETKLQAKLSENPDAVEKMFRGYTSTVRGSAVEFDGIFTKMNNELNSLIGDNGSVSLYEGNLKSNQSKLEEERDKAIERIDVRYEIMSNKFAAYDAMISSMNSGFQSLQMQIDAMVANNS